MIDWDFQDGKLTVTPHSLTVNSLEEIWKFDKTRTKIKATQLMKYVFFMGDIRMNNPLLNTKEAERPKRALFEAFSDFEYKFSRREKELVENALADYKLYNENSPMRALFAIDRKIDQASQLLDDTTLTEKNADWLMGLADSISKMQATRNKLEKMIREEMEAAKVRGKLARSPREAGMLSGIRKHYKPLAGESEGEEEEEIDESSIGGTEINI